MDTINLLFGMQKRVTRQSYIIWGVMLLLVKYAGEGLFYYFASMGEILTPLNFLSPLLQFRYPEFAHLPDGFGPVVALWSLPFIWIGFSTNIRISYLDSEEDRNRTQ